MLSELSNPTNPACLRTLKAQCLCKCGPKNRKLSATASLCGKGPDGPDYPDMITDPSRIPAQLNGRSKTFPLRSLLYKSRSFVNPVLHDDDSSMALERPMI